MNVYSTGDNSAIVEDRPKVRILIDCRESFGNPQPYINMIQSHTALVEALVTVRKEIADIQKLWPNVEFKGKFDQFESVLGALMQSQYQIDKALTLAQKGE